MASNKVVLRTAHPGDVFRIDDKTEVTGEGTEFPSKSAAADAIEAAALSGVQLYVVEPPEPGQDPDELLTERALVNSGLVDETESKPKPPASSQGNQQGGNG